MSAHLADKHQEPSDVRRQLTDFLKSRHPNLRNPKGVGPRDGGGVKDARLRTHEGFACRLCSFRTTHFPTMPRHMSDAHPEESRGRQSYGRRRVPPYDEVYLQAWTRNPAGSRYWIVQRNGSTWRPGGVSGVWAHLDGVLARERGLHGEEASIGVAAGAAGTAGTAASRAASTAAGMSVELGPWLERTGWEETYRHVNRDVLYALTLTPQPPGSPGRRLLGSGGSGASRLESDLFSPAEDERKIGALMAAVDGVMGRCEQTAQKTSRNLLCWLRSTQGRCHSKPFRLVSTAVRRAKYVALVKRLMATAFRAYRMAEGVRVRVTGIRLKRSQMRRLAAIWDHEVWCEEGAWTRGFWQRRDEPEGDHDLDSDSDDSDRTRTTWTRTRTQTT